MKRIERALVSIHDVMPSTINCVGELIDRGCDHGLKNITLLIVPGCDWNKSDVDQLHTWQAAGHEFAGHGWSHRCKFVRGWKHRLHSATISRNVAEHLCLGENEIVQLLSDCASWFQTNGFGVPDLYVPPAWALGAVSHENLSQSPFAMFETLTSLIIGGRHSPQRIPLLGFEADTFSRSVFLKAFNHLNETCSRIGGTPIRVAIHPFDHRLKLRGDLDHVLARVDSTISYGDYLQTHSGNSASSARTAASMTCG